MQGLIFATRLFGTEMRIIDGEECIVIPVKDNPCIGFNNGAPVIYFSAKELQIPDIKGFTHVIRGHIPKSKAQGMAQADFVKLSEPLGALRPVRPINSVPEPLKGHSGLDYRVLAPRGVTDDDIPL